MAKKGKGKKRHHRRVGASILNPRSPIVMIGSLALGYFLGDTINAQIDKMNTSTTPATANTPAVAITHVGATVLEIGQIGIGGLLLLKFKKPGMVGTLVKVGGGVLAGAGLRRFLKSQGIVSGYQSVPVIGRRMAGYQHVPVIGKMPAQLAGQPSQLQGFRVNGYVPTGSGSSKVMGSVGPIAGDAGYQRAYAGGSGYSN